LLPFSLHGQVVYEDAGIGAYTFSISSSFGIKYGQAEEIVFSDAVSDTKLSQLLWDMKPLFYWGAAFDFSQRFPMDSFGFFANAALQTALPGKTGVMEDRDWLAPGNGLSNFSSHENYTEEALFFDFTAGASIPVASWARVQIFAGISYMGLKWTAREGYLQYAAKSGNTYGYWNASLPKIAVYGPVIAYKQDWLIFTPGIALRAPLFDNFNAGLIFKIGPVIFCEDLDDHFERRLEFSESMYGGLMLEPRGEFSFLLNENINFSLDVSYRFIHGPRGDTKVRSTETNATQKSKDSGGSGYSVLDAALSVTLRL
jgi:outer membrane protease